MCIDHNNKDNARTSSALYTDQIFQNQDKARDSPVKLDVHVFFLQNKWFCPAKVEHVT
jgi:hypothetical protein